MSSSAEGSPVDPVDGPDKRAARKESNDAWAATSLLISGVVVWGGVGYLVSRWLGSPLFTMVGLLLGTATALYGIWFRYGRS
jgi:F0F1-type ATP synthase assembly protein I